MLQRSSRKAELPLHEAAPFGGQALAFGPFTLNPLGRVLREGERSIRLGSRAFEILLLLVERAGELVGKEEIMARVWPNIATEEVTLRVHIAALRKALGDGRKGVRYVENVTGRGYRFIAPLTRLDDSRPISVTPVAAAAAAAQYRPGLPTLLTRIIGRSHIMSALSARLLRQRLMTVVGPGGVGKTAVALATAEMLLPSFGHGAFFIDLAPVTEPRLVASALASALGVEVLSSDPVPALLAFLSDKQLLIVLDNCEHVAGAAAALAETLLAGTPHIRLLATSREPLRSAGEWIYRLHPLDVPPSSAGLNAAEALSFPAVELFAERALANLDNFRLSDADAPIVAELCRRLDGLPLAIELAAARVDSLGLRELAAQLDDCLQLLTRGRRTAALRHQTLRAMLDWSYGLLSGAERVILRRIAVFPGSFDLASASAVAADEHIGAAEMLDGIGSLSAKSLITAEVNGEQAMFRLLNTTRAHALEQLETSRETNAIRRRHAELCCSYWVQTACQATASIDQIADHRRLDDVRAALDWSFSPDGDASLGAMLTAASSPLWFQLSVPDEYRRRLEQSLQALEAASSPDAALEMRLNIALGYAIMHASGPSPAMAAAFERALEIADLLGDAAIRRLALIGLGMAYISQGDYASAVDVAERCRRASIDVGESASQPIERLLAQVHHFAGSQARARFHGERLLRGPGKRTTAAAKSPPHRMDPGAVARTTLCRVVWVAGFPEQALGMAHEAAREGVSANHALSLCYALCGSAAVLLWAGNAPAAGELIAMVLDHSARHALSYWLGWGRCLDVALTSNRGDRAGAARHYRDLLRDPLIGAPQLETLGTISETMVGAEVLARADTGLAGWSTAEILRAHGENLLREGAPDASCTAETLFRRALDTARGQEALSWELRAATSLARLWQNQGRGPQARDLLAPIYARFTEGFATADLTRARTLLKQLDT